MVEGIADSTLVLDGGYKVLEREEIVKILRAISFEGVALFYVYTHREWKR